MSPDDDPFCELREPVLDAASTFTPPTAADANRRLRRRRAQRAAAASVVVLVVVAGGIGLAGRAPERELTAAGVPGEAPTGTTPGGTYPGTVPGTAPTASVPGEPAPAEATTTTTTPVPSGEPTVPDRTPTTTPPDGPSVVFAGTYQGIGHYSQSQTSGSCGDINQDLDLSLALDDGRTWTYRSVYCAATDENGVWHGAGPFRITTDEGETLVGIFGATAQLPTDGVPYEIRITGGSGRYEGAQGSCALTVHLRDLDFGVQENTGTFSCTVQVPQGEPSAG